MEMSCLNVILPSYYQFKWKENDVTASVQTLLSYTGPDKGSDSNVRAHSMTYILSKREDDPHFRYLLSKRKRPLMNFFREMQFLI